MNTEKFNKLVEAQDYQGMSQEFLSMTDTDFTVNYERTGKYFTDDKDARDIYRIVLTRGNRSYAFNFGQSITNSGKYWLYGRNTAGMTRDRLKPDYISEKKSRGHSAFQDWQKNKNYAIPTSYDVLASITKYEPGDFENFCADFGYDTEKTYNAVKDEYNNLKMIFSDEEIELMQNIA